MYTDIFTMPHQCSGRWVFTCEIYLESITISAFYHSVHTRDTLHAHWRVTSLQYVLEIAAEMRTQKTARVCVFVCVQVRFCLYSRDQMYPQG